MACSFYSFPSSVAGAKTRFLPLHLAVDLQKSPLLPEGAQIKRGGARAATGDSDLPAMRENCEEGTWTEGFLFLVRFGFINLADLSSLPGRLPTDRIALDLS